MTWDLNCSTTQMTHFAVHIPELLAHGTTIILLEKDAQLSLMKELLGVDLLCKVESCWMEHIRVTDASC